MLGFDALGLEAHLEVVDAAGFELFGAVDPLTHTALIVTRRGGTKVDGAGLEPFAVVGLLVDAAPIDEHVRGDVAVRSLSAASTPVSTE